MSDIFNEVDEALRREKAAKFWKEYGPTLIAAAILMVVATGLTTAYKTWDSHRNKQETTKLILAAEEKDIAGAMEKAAVDTRDGHKGVALLNAAAKYAEKKDFAKAAALYDSLSKDSGANTELRDLGNILYARSAILMAKGKDADYKALAERLNSVAENDKSPFQLQAKLDAALLYGNGLKDYTKALDLLQGFEADSAADSLKEKANALQHVYEYELSKTAPAAAPSKP
jgi:hypothetical protein